MKLLTYNVGNGPRAGVLQDNKIIDLTTLLGTHQTLKDVQALLELSDMAVDMTKWALEKKKNTTSFPLNSVKLMAPILRPPTMRDFMIFEEHGTGQGTREQTPAFYKMPIAYFTNTLCIYGPNETVPYPSASQRLDYELELGCVIGREGRNVSPENALDYIAGFCIFNDWSARDIQADEMSVHLGAYKGKDFATSIGPWVVTTDEMEPFIKEGRLAVKCNARVNEDLWCKDSFGGNAYHTWNALVVRASHNSRIAVGDVFGTGTVGGGSIGEAISKGQGNARYLKPGDIVEMEVEGIGVLKNTIGQAELDDKDYPYKADTFGILPERGSRKDYKYNLTASQAVHGKPKF